MALLSPHFCAKEFACRCGCGFGLNPGDVLPELVSRLEILRGLMNNHPLIIESGCRCPTQNVKVGGSQNSQHMLGRAADIINIMPDILTARAIQAGFRGVITYRWGVHVDVRQLPEFREDRRKRK